MVDAGNVEATLKDIASHSPKDDLNDDLIDILAYSAKSKRAGYDLQMVTLSLAGHVDAGKTTCSAFMKYRLSEISAKEKQIVESNQGVNIIEKGTDAKKRGITIETTSHRLMCPVTITLKADDARKAAVLADLKDLEYQFEEKTEGENVLISYKLPFNLNDCPGHEDFLTNCLRGLQNSTCQGILVPPSYSGENFSTSNEHLKAAVATNCDIFICLSKTDMQESPEKLMEFMDNIHPVVTKLALVRKERYPAVPISAASYDKAFNMVEPYRDGNFKLYKGMKYNRVSFNPVFPDQRQESNPTAQCLLDIVRRSRPRVCIESYGGIGTSIQLTEIHTGVKGVSRVYTGIVMTGVVRKGMVMTSTEHNDTFEVATLQQYRKDTDKAVMGANIGFTLKRKGSKDPSEVRNNDVLHMGFAKDKQPVFSKFAECKAQFFKKKKSVRTYKPGLSVYAVSLTKCEASIRYVSEVKEAKNVTKGTPEKPILYWQTGNVISCIVEFHAPKPIITLEISRQYQSPFFMTVSQEVIGSAKTEKAIVQKKGVEIPSSVKAAKAAGKKTEAVAPAA